MKYEKLTEAMNEISDHYLDEAVNAKKARLPRWIGAVAAVLALAIAVGCILPLLHRQPEDLQLFDPTTLPLFHKEETSFRFLAAKPEYPRMSAYPKDPTDSHGHQNWFDDQRTLHNQPEGYADSLEGYFASLIPTLFQGLENQNAACSPLNIYMALAMLAEITDGGSRQQILELLQAKDMETLREQANQVWKAHYNDDGLSKSILGSSLWLEEGVEYNENTAKVLAEHYYASVFRGDLGSVAMNEELRNWINQQTDGVLRQQTQDLELSREAILCLVTTVCYQVQWQDRFLPEQNTEGTFHTPAGEQTVTYMHRELPHGPYYWGEKFGAVYLPLEDGSRMWLILPDEGAAPKDILDEAAAFLSQKPAYYNSTYQNQKNIRVQLSLPKFDVSGQLELSDTLKKMGITDIFESGKSDFSPIFPEITDGSVGKISHTARVKIDEEGVTAAAFTEIQYCGSAPPPEEEIHFTLDRPFVFYVESRDGLPLFTGIVNNP